jgi:putative molybdopterin biosynthesis protein
VQNPLFDLLSAVREHGSIQHAAKASWAPRTATCGAQCKHWEEVLGEPLVHWVQGQPARLTPFAERLLWAEKRARSRLVPHIEALRAELERVLAEALDGSQQVLTVTPATTWPCRAARAAAASAAPAHRAASLPAAWTRCARWPKGAARWRASTCRRWPTTASSFARGLKPLLKPGRTS